MEIRERRPWAHLIAIVVCLFAAGLSASVASAGTDDPCDIMVKLTRARFVEEVHLNKVPMNSELKVPSGILGMGKSQHLQFVQRVMEDGRSYLYLRHVEKNQLLRLSEEEFINGHGKVELTRAFKVPQNVPQEILDEDTTAPFRTRDESEDAFAKTPPHGVPVLDENRVKARARVATPVPGMAIIDTENVARQEHTKTPSQQDVAIVLSGQAHRPGQEAKTGLAAINKSGIGKVVLPAHLARRSSNEALPVFLPEHLREKPLIRAEEVDQTARTIVGGPAGAKAEEDAARARGKTPYEEKLDRLRQRVFGEELPPEIEKAKHRILEHDELINGTVIRKGSVVLEGARVTRKFYYQGVWEEFTIYYPRVILQRRKMGLTWHEAMNVLFGDLDEHVADGGFRHVMKSAEKPGSAFKMMDPDLILSPSGAKYADEEKLVLMAQVQQMELGERDFLHQYMNVVTPGTKDDFHIQINGATEQEWWPEREIIRSDVERPDVKPVWDAFIANWQKYNEEIRLIRKARFGVDLYNWMGDEPFAVGIDVGWNFGNVRIKRDPRTGRVMIGMLDW